jgi:hypothetical protein
LAWTIADSITHSENEGQANPALTLLPFWEYSHWKLNGNNGGVLKALDVFVIHHRWKTVLLNLH